VQGEGGMTAGTPEFIQGLRKACDEHGLLLILDEIQCGYGRTGKMWAYEHYGITPDILTSAKGHWRRLPAGCLPCTEEAAKGMVAARMARPMAATRLAMAAGQAILDVMTEPGFLEHVTAMGDRLRAAFEQLIPNHDDLFEEIRGQGPYARHQDEGTRCQPRFRGAFARQSRAADGCCRRKCLPRSCRRW
jgi:acetylornithine/N-succinyldiaminopimelate aminotransferase